MFCFSAREYNQGGFEGIFHSFVFLCELVDEGPTPTGPSPNSLSSWERTKVANISIQIVVLRSVKLEGTNYFTKLGIK